MPEVDYADADGPLLLNSDLAIGLTYNDGKVELQPSPGLGITTTF
jgi:hypothetical protein